MPSISLISAAIDPTGLEIVELLKTLNEFAWLNHFCVISSQDTNVVNKNKHIINIIFVLVL